MEPKSRVVPQRLETCLPQGVIAFMYRLALVWFVLTLAGFPHSAHAQRYQRHSDGLVGVHAKRTVERPVRLEVCAELIRAEEACPVEVHLVFRGASGRFLGQRSPVLRPHFGAPACTRVDLPGEAHEMARWAVARFRCQRPERDRADAVPAWQGG